MGKRTLHLTLLFALGTLLISVTTIAAGFLIMLLLLWLGVFDMPIPEVQAVGVLLSSALIGTLSAHGLVKRALAPILEISEAAKQVAKGDFQITLTQRSRAKEIQELAQSFLWMVRELAAIETLRSDFVSNVSHEFKSPLSAIEGYATLLQAPDLDKATQQAYVARILFNTKRLSGLSSNLLLLSHLENQNAMPEQAVFSLDEQLRQSILLFEGAWTKKNLILDIDLDPIDYTGSEDLLAQVWQNLIGNAVKFTRQGDTIRITLRRQPGQVVCTVADTGIGMSRETQQRIFEKFYQGDASRAVEGNGLGLPLVKRILALHGGTVAVVSRPDRGSTFTVVLPQASTL